MFRLQQTVVRCNQSLLLPSIKSFSFLYSSSPPPNIRRHLHSSSPAASILSAFTNVFKRSSNSPEAVEEERYYKVITTEEEFATPDETKALKDIEKKLLKLDELTNEAAALRQQRRNILSSIRERLDSTQAEKDRIAKYMKERETYTGHSKAGPDAGIVLYLFRHIQNGKIFVSETQFLDEKQFHHQLGLKKFEAVIRFRSDHWEPLLAVTGLPYKRDVQRLKEYVLDPKKQEIPRARRPLREKKGIKPHPERKKAVENLEYSKKSVTRLNQGLEELQRDCNDLDNVKILWSRPAERHVLLRAGVDPEGLKEAGKWVPFVKHDGLQVEFGRKIINIQEDISFRVECGVRRRLMKPMPARNQPWYPLLGPGRHAFLQKEKERTGKAKVVG